MIKDETLKNSALQSCIIFNTHTAVVGAFADICHQAGNQSVYVTFTHTSVLKFPPSVISIHLKKIQLIYWEAMT